MPQVNQLNIMDNNILSIPVEYVGKITYDEVINDNVIHKEITGIELEQLFYKTIEDK